jgi:hypothetical protein
VTAPLHVDDFIDDFSKNTPELKYARWFFMLHRLPSNLVVDFQALISPYRLFCTYAGKRYRVTGASQMGDIWLNTDQTKDYGHELRVDVTLCDQWSREP